MRRKSFLWLITGTLFFAVSNGNWIFPVAAWIAPILFLRFLRETGSIRELIFLFMVILVSTRFMLIGIIPDLGPLTYLLTIYYAIIWYFPYWMHKLLAHRIKGFRSTLLFPVSGVTAEFLNTTFFGSWGSWAYTQFGDLPLMQLVSVTGIWGLTFLILWTGSVTDWIWHEKMDWGRMRSRGWIFGAVFFAVLLYGGARIHLYEPSEMSGPIVSFTPKRAIEEFLEDRSGAGFSSTSQMARESRESLDTILADAHNRIYDQMDALHAFSPALILWPEATISVLQEQERDFLKRASIYASTHQTYVLIAYYLVPRNTTQRVPENKSVLVAPTGQVEFTFLKAHPTPGAGHKAGEKLVPVIETPLGRIASTICYDMEFTSFVHQAGRNKADIMLVPAWDWKAINPLHTNMAVFRGVENGFSVVRQTGEGLSMATDAVGRVLAQMDYFISPSNVMISEVPMHRYPTLYTVIGDTFAWLCMFTMALLIFTGITSKTIKVVADSR